MLSSSVFIIIHHHSIDMNLKVDSELAANDARSFIARSRERAERGSARARARFEF